LKISKDEQEWFKANRAVIIPILKTRQADYIAKLLDERDPLRTEVLKAQIREFQMWETLANNIGNLKERKRKKDSPEFTGV